MTTTMQRPTWNPLASLAAPTGPPTLFVASVSAAGMVEHVHPEAFAGLVPGAPLRPDLREAVEACHGAPCVLPADASGLSLAVAHRTDSGTTVFGARSAPSRLAHLVEAVPVGVLRIAPDGQIRYANAAAAALLASTPEALVGTFVWDSAAHPEDQNRLAQALRDARGQRALAVPFRRSALHGGSRMLEAHLVPDPDGDLLSVVLLDLTVQSDVEAALQQSEALYATFLEQSPMGLVHLDTTGTVTFENLRFRAIVGEAADDAWIGRRVDTLSGLDTAFLRVVGRVLGGTAVHDAPATFAPPGRGPRHLVVNAAPIQHEDGALIGAVLMVHDQTKERAHADEAALRQRFATAESGLRERVLAAVSETEFLHDAALALTRALGADRTGVFLPLTLHPDTFTVRTSCGAETDAFEAEAFVPDAVPELHAAVAARHVVALVEDEAEPDALAERVFVPFYDQDALAGLIVSDRLARDDNGRHVAPLVDALTAGLLAEFAHTVGALWGNLRLANRFRFTVSAIDDALFTYSFSEAGQRRFLFLTDQVERLTGYPAAHFLRHDGAWEALCASDADRRALAEHTARLLRGEESSVVVALRTASGQTRYVRERASLTTDETSAFQLAGIFSDVTEQRAAEDALKASAAAAEQASRDKSAFISTLSHELRTPLGALHGFADLLDQELGPEASDAAREFAGTIREKAHQTLALVNDLFDLTHLDLGHVALSSAPVPLGPLVAEAVARASVHARAGVETQVHVPDPSPIALADPKRLLSILDNLLSNAYKFTHEGRVRVRAWQADHRVALRVEDTGVGMSEAFLERVFLPFVQEDQRLNRDYNGTGLGLALAHRLVERMHGTLEVESVKDAGSAFTLWLPAA